LNFPITDILRFSAVAILLLMALILFPKCRTNKNLIPGILLCWGLICYLLVDWAPMGDYQLFYYLLPGAFSVSYFFWLFSKSIFDDEFEYEKVFYIGLVAVIVVYYIIYLQNRFYLLGSAPALHLISGFLAQLISLVFVILAILEAFRGKASDLVEGRLKFRYVFIITAASVIIITLVVEISLKDMKPPPTLEFIQKLFIAGLAFFFSVKTLQLKHGFLFKEPQKATKVDELAKDPSQQRILDKLSQAMKEEKCYKKEGLTISKLAQQLEEQEYKVRKVINQQMGYNNFNQYLNSFRVVEACQVLSNPQKAEFTVLEIAYSLGYQSLAPFNKAFKQQTQLTPTEYRKKHMS